MRNPSRRRPIAETFAILDPEYSWQQASAAQIYVMLGLAKGAKLPVEGMPSRIIEGVRVFVTPMMLPNPSRFKRSTHRVLCECPGCHKILSVGRLRQHVCKSTPSK